MSDCNGVVTYSEAENSQRIWGNHLLIVHHNEIRYRTAKLLTRVCHDVEVKPHLQPSNNKTFHYITAKTGLGILMNGFWETILK